MLVLDLGGLIRASTLAVIGVLGSFGADRAVAASGVGCALVDIRRNAVRSE
jgi:hypothetical protein